MFTLGLQMRHYFCLEYSEISSLKAASLHLRTHGKKYQNFFLYVFAVETVTKPFPSSSESLDSYCAFERVWMNSDDRRNLSFLILILSLKK